MNDREQLRLLVEQITKQVNYKPRNNVETLKAYKALATSILPTQSRSMFSLDGIQVLTNWNRVVIGDYGPYIEFGKEQACEGNYSVPTGQAWRLRSKLNIKYLWYQCGKPPVKIYKQVKRVSYADYTPGMFYVAPWEVFEPGGVLGGKGETTIYC